MSSTNLLSSSLSSDQFHAALVIITESLGEVKPWEKATEEDEKRKNYEIWVLNFDIIK